MNIVACIKRVPTTEAQAEVAADGKSLDTSGFQYMALVLRRDRGRGGRPDQGEARRRGHGADARARAMPRRSCASAWRKGADKARDPEGRRAGTRATRARRPRSWRSKIAALGRGASSSAAASPPTATTRPSGRCSRRSSAGRASPMSIGSSSRRQGRRAKRETEARRRDRRVRAAGRDHLQQGPERAALRRPQGHHGRQEEADRGGRGRGRARTRRASTKLELPPPRKAGRIVGEGAAAVPALIAALRDEAEVL